MFGRENLTVLYMENNTEIRSEVTHFMRDNGLRVFETDNSTDACSLFQKNKVDVILFNLELHQKNGLDFINSLREKDIETPVVIITDHIDSESLLEAINLDITRYLIKPVSEKQLLEALGVAIKKSMNCHPITFCQLKDGFSYDPISKCVKHPIIEKRVHSHRASFEK